MLMFRVSVIWFNHTTLICTLERRYEPLPFLYVVKEVEMTVDRWSTDSLEADINDVCGSSTSIAWNQESTMSSESSMIPDEVHTSP